MINSHTSHIKNSSYFSFGDTITTTITQRLSTLSQPGKEYLCFQIEEKSAHAAQCAKSRALIIVLKVTFDNDSFEQQCFIIKELLQSKQLKKHVCHFG